MVLFVGFANVNEKQDDKVGPGGEGGGGMVWGAVNNFVLDIFSLKLLLDT